MIQLYEKPSYLNIFIFMYNFKKGIFFMEKYEVKIFILLKKFINKDSVFNIKKSYR